MLRLIQLHSHWSPEEAYSVLMLLDELRDTIWQNYGNEIIDYCHKQEINQENASSEIEDDIIPF